MSQRWFFCPDLKPGRVVLDEGEARHALGSLRLRPGDALTAFDGRGHVARATLEAVSTLTRAPVPSAGRARRRKRPAAILIEAIDTLPPPSRTLTLIVPACKGVRLDWLVEKCTELGVGRLVLAEFERSVVHAGPQHVDRLRRTAVEACKQCHRPWVPQIEAGTPLTDALTAVAGAVLLVAHPASDAEPVGQWLGRRVAGLHKLAVVIGPEGGLSASEVELLRAGGGHLVRLAEHVLRVETAALAIAANWAASAVVAT